MRQALVAARPYIEQALSAWAAPGPLLTSSAGTRTKLAGTRRAMERRQSVKERYVPERGSRMHIAACAPFTKKRTGQSAPTESLTPVLPDGKI